MFKMGTTKTVRRDILNFYEGEKGKQEYFYKRPIVVSLLLLIFGLLIIKKEASWLLLDISLMILGLLKVAY
jgi:hypothetical protein